MNLLIPFLILSCGEINIFSIENFGSKSKFNRDNTTNFKIEPIQKEKDLEYPRNNNYILEKIRDMWRKYYSCLKEKENKNKKPEIIYLLEGQFTELTCNVCQKPFQDYEELEWKYKPLFSDTYIREPEHLDLSPEMTLTSNKTLKIFNLLEELSGLYVCYQGKSTNSIYILEVSKSCTIEKANPFYLQNKSIIYLKGINLEINYKWSPWTECSACGTVGKKFKYGYCLVSIKQVTVYDKISKLNMQKTIENNLSNNDEFIFTRNFWRHKRLTLSDKENLSWAAHIIEKFENGIPCASSFLPNALLETAQNFTSIKTMIKYCSVPCKEPEIFEVLDKFGNLIEMANNSAGIYSVFQNPPPLFPEIKRRSIVTEFGKEIIIQCPGSLLLNIPVTWKVNKKIILPEIIATESNKRFIVDLVNRIHLKKLRLKDSNIYSCWQRDRLVGTVYLNVEKKLQIGFNHHITLIGMMAVIGTFLFVGTKIITRQLNNRRK